MMAMSMTMTKSEGVCAVNAFAYKINLYRFPLVFRSSDVTWLCVDGFPARCQQAWCRRAQWQFRGFAAFESEVSKETSMALRVNQVATPAEEPA